jgi:hypothetical protein
MTFHSTIEVIDALGGTQPVADLTGRTYNAAFNWRSAGKFPCNTYLKMQAALAAHGHNAPASLWGMAEAELAS